MKSGFISHHCIIAIYSVNRYDLAVQPMLYVIQINKIVIWLSTDITITFFFFFYSNVLIYPIVYIVYAL